MDFYDACGRYDYGRDFPWEGGIVEHHCKVLADLPMTWHHSEMDPDGKLCVWQGNLWCPLGLPRTTWETTTPAPPSTTTEMQWYEFVDPLVELIFHPLVGWMIIHEGSWWLKDVNPMDCLEAEGQYTCICPPDTPPGTVIVTEVPCPAALTEAETTTTVEETTTTEAEITTTAAPTTSTTTAAPGPADCCYFCVLHTAGTETLTLNCQDCGPEECPDIEGCLYDIAPGYSGDAEDPLCYKLAPPCTPWPREDELGVKKAYHLDVDSCWD